MRQKAIVLLSGGLDSATVLAIVKQRGLKPYALSFDYGQRHAVELEAAERIAANAGATHRVARIDLRLFGGSALTDDIPVPKSRSDAEIGGGVPVTYVPARNTIFLSFALAWAEVLDATDLFIGVNALDYSGYPDCRPDYIAAYEAMANLARANAGDGRRLRIHTPLIDMTKADIVTLGTSLGVDYAATISCYDPDPVGRACGECDSCRLRAKGFREAGLPDPTRYRETT